MSATQGGPLDLAPVGGEVGDRAAADIDPDDAEDDIAALGQVAVEDERLSGLDGVRRVGPAEVGASEVRHAHDDCVGTVVGAAEDTVAVVVAGRDGGARRHHVAGRILPGRGVGDASEEEARAGDDGGDGGGADVRHDILFSLSIVKAIH